MGWLYLFLARLATGERWRKATPEDYRYGAGLFLTVPIVFTVLLVLERAHSPILQILDRGSSMTLRVVITFVALTGFFAVSIWNKYVSAKVSMILAIFAWGILLFLLFGLGYWDFGKL